MPIYCAELRMGSYQSSSTSGFAIIEATGKIAASRILDGRPWALRNLECLATCANVETGIEIVKQRLKSLLSCLCAHSGLAEATATAFLVEALNRANDGGVVSFVVITEDETQAVQMIDGNAYWQCLHVTAFELRVDAI
jgi:hypothetical protein